MTDSLDREIAEAVPDGVCRNKFLRDDTRQAVRALVERLLQEKDDAFDAQHMRLVDLYEARGAAKALEGLAEWIKDQTGAPVNNNENVATRTLVCMAICNEIERRAKGEK